jgi:peptidoglycan/xylan/chitin deacetylase (PgdA/CDA1 family)
MLLGLAGLSAWLSLGGDFRWVAIGLLLGLYVVLFSLGIGVIRFGYFVRSFCRSRQPGAGVVLSFDDGPDPSGTQGLLEALSRHGIKAVFFPTGKKAEAHPELLQAIDQAGHLIGNHSYRHAWFTSLLAGKALEQELVKAQQVIEAATGKAPAFFRPPAGLTNPHFPKVLKKLGLVSVGWDVRAFDTRNKAETVVQRILSRVRAGSILLLHEGCRDPASLEEMVDALVAGIRNRGFAFTDLEEMTGLQAYQRPGNREAFARLSLAEAWRRSSHGSRKGRLARCSGLWLASTAGGRKAILEKADLSAFRERPSKRFLAGVGLILVSYVLGWPMVGLFTALAAYFQNPGLLIGGPLSYGFSHLVFLGGMVLAGRDSLRYLERFSRWSLRLLVQRLTGQDAAKALGADSA